MRKKLAAIALVYTMVFAAGCGSNQENAAESRSAQETVSAQESNNSVESDTSEELEAVSKAEVKEEKVSEESEVPDDLISQISGRDNVVASVASDDKKGIEDALSQVKNGSVNLSLGTGQVQILDNEIPDDTNEEADKFISEGLDSTELGKIIENDDRVEVPKEYQTTFPCSPVVFMEVEYSDGTFYHCTGSLIGRDTVLTAAYNLVEPTKGGFPVSVIVVPAFSKASYPFGSANATDVIVPQEFYDSAMKQKGDDWYDKTDVEYDFGIIKLDSRIGEYTGYFGLSYSENGTANKIDIATIGYNSEGVMVSDEVTINKSDENFMYYDIDVDAVMVGAPLFMEDGRIFGIVTAGTSKDGKNAGVYFDKDDIDWIIDYLR